ncbi:amidohydrolase family protein, partial [Streptomyces sp. JV185]|uniref:amidohydrolase family protein n=1 Tax=Streptomyces sp. JV185 TaxID=858638 RepID=UPI002E76681E
PIPCTQKVPSTWTDRTPRQGSSSQLRRHFRVTAHDPDQSPSETRRLGVDGYTSRTEGPLAARTRHPLFFTGHVHYLAHHVLRAKTLGLEEAVRKVTLMVADRFRLSGRGRVRPGQHADLALLDLSALAAQDTFAFTGTYAAGVPHMLVNGEPVIHHGQHLGSRPGRYLSGR